MPRTITAALIAAGVLLLTAAPADAARHSKSDRSFMKRTVQPHKAWFERVAACESNGQWHINTGNGFYGGLQFALLSWRAVGGTGYPHQASKLEQIYRGVKLLRLQGPGAWPVCSRRAA